MTEKRPWSPSQLRKYNIQLEQIPRLDHNDPKIDDLMKENVRLYKFLFFLFIFNLNKIFFVEAIYNNG